VSVLTVTHRRAAADQSGGVSVLTVTHRRAAADQSGGVSVLTVTHRRAAADQSGGLYPRNSECRYELSALPTERIHVRFTYFDVEGISPK